MMQNIVKEKKEKEKEKQDFKNNSTYISEEQFEIHTGFVWPLEKTTTRKKIYSFIFVTL